MENKETRIRIMLNDFSENFSTIDDTVFEDAYTVGLSIAYSYGDFWETAIIVFCSALCTPIHAKSLLSRIGITLTDMDFYNFEIKKAQSMILDQIRPIFLMS